MQKKLVTHNQVVQDDASKETIIGKINYVSGTPAASVPQLAKSALGCTLFTIVSNLNQTFEN